MSLVTLPWDVLRSCVLPNLDVGECVRALRLVNRTLHDRLSGPDCVPPRHWTASPETGRSLRRLSLAHWAALHRHLARQHGGPFIPEHVHPHPQWLDPLWYAASLAGVWSEGSFVCHVGRLEDLLRLVTCHREALRWPLEGMDGCGIRDALWGHAWRPSALLFRLGAHGEWAVNQGHLLPRPRNGNLVAGDGGVTCRDVATLRVVIAAARRGLVSLDRAPCTLLREVYSSPDPVLPAGRHRHPLHIRWIEFLVSDRGARLCEDGVVGAQPVPGCPVGLPHPTSRRCWELRATRRRGAQLPTTLLWWDTPAARWARGLGLVACHAPTAAGVVACAAAPGAPDEPSWLWETRAIDHLWACRDRVARDGPPPLRLYVATAGVGAPRRRPIPYADLVTLVDEPGSVQGSSGPRPYTSASPTRG